MNAEKIVKLQARKSLGKNNWSTAIGCFAVTLMIVFLILFLYYCLLYGFDLVNIITSEIKNDKIHIANLLTYLTMGLFILATPVFSGYTKICHNIAKYGKSSTYDLFFYFTKSKLYFKALGVNILKGLILSPFVTLGFTGFVISFGIIGAEIKSLEPIIAIGIAIILLAVVLFIYFYARLSFVNNILAENPYTNVTFCISESFAITKGKTISTIKLILSFTLWYALCFFVLPIFYVVPYAKAAKSTSAKWLIKIRKEEFR